MADHNRLSYGSLESTSSQSSTDEYYRSLIHADSFADIPASDTAITPTNESKSMPVTELSDDYVRELKTQFFNLGLISGASLQMFLVSVILMVVSYSQHSGPLIQLSHEYYPIFRCIFFIAFFFSLYGANLFIWRRAKIDYRSILHVSSAHTYQYVLRGSASVAYITFTCFMLYIITITGGLDFIKVSYLKHIFPALAVLLPILLFLCPWDTPTATCYGVKQKGAVQRYHLLQSIGAVLLTPYTTTTFQRSFIADIMCSMPKIFTDLLYTVCLYSTGSFWDENKEWEKQPHMHAYDTCGAGGCYSSIFLAHVNIGSPTYKWLQTALSFLPFYLRLMQSLQQWSVTSKSRHLLNALKYTLSLSMTGLALLYSMYPHMKIYNMLWLAVSIITSLYAFLWDVTMDWGLGNLNVPHVLLRERLIFAPRSYYLAMAANCIMRFGWALLISPSQNYVEQHVILILGCVELVRRFVWAIFRIEWEHINKEMSSSRRRSGSSKNEENQQAVALLSQQELRSMTGHRSASEIIREIF